MTLIEVVDINLDFIPRYNGDMDDGLCAASTVYPHDNITDLDDYEVGDMVEVSGIELRIESIDEDGTVDLIECD